MSRLLTAALGGMNSSLTLKGYVKIFALRRRQAAVHFIARHPSLLVERYHSLSGSQNIHGPLDAEHIPPIAEKASSAERFSIPKRSRQKVIRVSDAVSLVNSKDTIYVSGFVTQGCAELIVKALGERYDSTGEPHSLTLLFGGGPGDYATKGLNHLAKTQPTSLPDSADPTLCKPMIKRAIGGHYGQTPMIAALALNEQIEAWTLPMGSISRMLRAQSTHSPGHITTVGLGTYVDPVLNGGAANESAKKSKLHSLLVSRVEVAGSTHLMYKALPINVAIIRGTTADTLGNITIEEESLKCDQMVAAAAARNSGGITIAQVKRLAATGSLPSRSIEVPGALVDCLVVVDEEDHDSMHPMSYVTKRNPVLTGEIRAPSESNKRLPLDIQKVIGRRAFFSLRVNTVINLGIGLPESVASIAAEEGLLEYLTLSTEPGVFGGVPASGHEFGPAANADGVVQMNQMFDFIDGGGLSVAVLGAAEVGKTGDVNVSRLSKTRLTGPGGFIDISQSTSAVVFVSPFTTKGLDVEIPGDGRLRIKKEGEVRKFVDTVFERTFSGDEAVRRGQSVLYVTERAVFRRSAKHDVIELIEIADGVDLQKVSEGNLCNVLTHDL
jgi:propionate CoA-transferase